MRRSKVEYINVLLLGLPRNKHMVEAALIFYHAEVPMNVARGYLETIARKLK